MSSPRILRTLNYPHALSRQYLATPGAAHAWPSILGALNWLRELVLQVDEKLEQIHPFDDEQTRLEEPIGRAFHEMHIAAYQHYRSSGSELPPHILQEFGDQVNFILNCPSSEEWRQTEERLKQLELQLTSYADGDNQLADFKAQLTELDSAVHARTQEIKHVEAQLQSVQTELDEAKKAEADQIRTNKDLKKRLNAIKERLREQAKAGVGAQIQEYQMLKERYESRIKAKGELQEEVEQMELALSRREGRIAPALDDYNRLVGTIRAAEYEEVAKGCDLKIQTYRMGFDITKELPSLIDEVTVFREHARNCVTQVEQQCAVLSRRITETCELIQNLGLSSIQTDLKESEAECEKLEQLLCSVDAELEADKRHWADEQQIHSNRCSDLRTRLSNLRSEISKAEETVEQLMRLTSAKAAFLDGIEKKTIAFIPIFRNFVASLELQRRATEDRANMFRDCIRAFTERMEKKMEKVLNDAEIENN
ncbi:kinetochore protein NDC80 [Clonorchis sinensis]|uniref:Kinetochore protein NDC80 n=1 Tax=Clonorchis sinensis TaxID=79923 RepID=H2KQ50_CLOSI|nr:kinetochore protein NDC80 [Clonorchis sinensis]